MVKIINYTPHDVTIKDNNGLVHTFLKTGKVARVQSPQKERFTLGCYTAVGETTFSVFQNYFGSVYVEHSDGSENSDLPPFEAGVYYVVSTLVKQALPDRYDLICPNSSDAVKNDKGHIIYTNGFMLP
jgi:hypothetical protein